jgi:hypothetical protein
MVTYHHIYPHNRFESSFRSRRAPDAHCFLSPRSPRDPGSREPLTSSSFRAPRRGSIPEPAGNPRGNKRGINRPGDRVGMPGSNACPGNALIEECSAVSSEAGTDFEATSTRTGAARVGRGLSLREFGRPGGVARQRRKPFNRFDFLNRRSDIASARTIRKLTILCFPLSDLTL